jgi:hypothetical protein
MLRVELIVWACPDSNLGHEDIDSRVRLGSVARSQRTSWDR